LVLGRFSDLIKYAGAWYGYASLVLLALTLLALAAWEMASRGRREVYFRDGMSQAAQPGILPRARGRDAVRGAARSRRDFGRDPLSAPQHLLSGTVPGRAAHA